MGERIFLTDTNASAIPYQGSTLGHHVVLNYIDSNGHHLTLQGLPEHKFERNFPKLGAFLQEEVGSDGANNRDSPFGRLQAHVEPGSNVALTTPYTMVAEGDDLSRQWARMTNFGVHVNSAGYEYRPYSQNSNSFAAGALKRAGFLGPGAAFPEIFDRLPAVDPASGETRALPVPGFDQRLANPINEVGVGTIGARVTPPVRYLSSPIQNPLGAGMAGWNTSVDGSQPPRPAQPSPSPQRPGGLPDMRSPAMTPQYHPETGAPLRFLDGSPVMGPPSEQQRLGGVLLKYFNERMVPTTAQEPAGRFPDLAAGADPEPAPDTPTNAAPGFPRLTRMVSSAFAGSNPPDPTPAPSPQTDRPLGLLTGQPMPDWPVPPPIFDFGNRRGQQDPRASSTPFLDEYIRYLNRVNGA